MLFQPGYHSIAQLIDHAILQPTLTDAEMERTLRELLPHPIATVCIKAHGIALAAEILEGSETSPCAVIGFPHGTPIPEVKNYETACAIRDGASEVDMVVNTGKVLSGDWEYVKTDILAVLEPAHEKGALVKVIFETDFLPADADKIKLCELCTELGVDFVKTSTGFGFVKGKGGNYDSMGATEHDLMLMRKYSGPQVGVKASGGMRTLDHVLRAVELGVTRIGTSSSLAILAEARERFGDVDA